MAAIVHASDQCNSPKHILAVDARVPCTKTSYQQAVRRLLMESAYGCTTSTQLVYLRNHIVAIHLDPEEIQTRSQSERPHSELGMLNANLGLLVL